MNNQQPQFDNLFQNRLYELSVATFNGKTDLIPTIRAKLVYALVTADWSAFRDINGYEKSNNWKDECTSLYKKREDIVSGDRFAVLITDKQICVGKAKPRTGDVDVVTVDEKNDLGRKKTNMFMTKTINGVTAYDLVEYDEHSDHYKNLMYISVLFMDQFLNEVWMMKPGDLAIKFQNRGVTMIETLNFLGVKYLTKQINLHMASHKKQTVDSEKKKCLKNARNFIKTFSKLTKFAVLCHNFVAFKYGKPINEDSFQTYLKGGYQTIYKFKGDIVTSHSTPNPDESYPILGFGVLRWENKTKEKAMSKNDGLLSEEIDFKELMHGIDLFSFDTPSK